MWNAVRSAVGPSGRAVMAQSTSRLVITRSGGHILNLAFASPPDPVFSLLLQSATDFHQCFGDGVKTFVTFLNTLIEHIQLRNTKSLVNKLSTFKVQLDSCFFLDKKCMCVLTDGVLQNVINTFFLTRFTHIVSKILAKLVFEWVCKLDTLTDVSTYISNFSILNLQSSPFSVSLSTIQSGFLLKGLYPKKLPPSDNHCIIKVYYLPSDVTHNSGDVEADILEILGEVDRKFCVLFVTNTILEERALFILNYKNIYFIHGACTDSTKFLQDKSLVHDNLIMKYQHVNEFLWISLPNVHQLLLKAPSSIVCAEYADGALDCLKMLYSCFKDCSCTILANGCFEHVLARQICSTSNSFGQIPPIKGRDQILAWKSASHAELNIQNHINLSKLQNIEIEVVRLVCPALLSILTTESDNKESLEPLYLRLNIISRALDTLINLCKLDGAFIKPKKGRLGP